MQFTKEAKTIQEQVDLLESRGMHIADKDEALHHLSHISYYRLQAYWLPYETTRNPHQFNDKADFNKVLSHYLFDRELRLLLLDAIERIEVSFRTQWAYHISHAYGPHGYMRNDKGMRKNERRFNNDLEELKKQVRRSDEVFIGHYKVR